jgi:PAS domain S-box
VHAEEALKESEELYRKLIATLPDIICITNVNGEIIFLNEVGIRFSGYSNFEEVKHKNFISFISDEDRERITRNFRASFRKNFGPQEYKFVNIHGEEFLFEIQREVLRSSDNTPYGLIFPAEILRLEKS